MAWDVQYLSPEDVDVEFSCAVSDSELRIPEWFVLRYVAGKERLILELLRQTKLAFHHLEYDIRLPRTKGWTKRAWFPGYVFVEFCKDYDDWGQILRMPYALEVLGRPTPLPSNLIEDLLARLPKRFTRPSVISCVAPGTRVRVKKGSFEGHEAPVMWSDRRKLKIILMLFASPVEATVDISDVEIIG